LFHNSYNPSRHPIPCDPGFFMSRVKMIFILNQRNYQQPIEFKTII